MNSKIRLDDDRDKKGSAYCAPHNRYYRADAGCEVCAFEESLIKQGKEIPRLQKCPRCGETTLLLHRCSNRYECLNFNCTVDDLESE